MSLNRVYSHLGQFAARNGRRYLHACDCYCDCAKAAHIDGDYYSRLVLRAMKASCMLGYVVYPLPATTGGHPEAKSSATFTHLFPVHAGGKRCICGGSCQSKNAAIEVNAPDQTSPRLSGILRPQTCDADGVKPDLRSGMSFTISANNITGSNTFFPNSSMTVT